MNLHPLTWEDGSTVQMNGGTRVVTQEQPAPGSHCPLVRVLHGTLPVGAFKAVRESFNVRPKTVAKHWHTTMRLLQGVPGYQPNAPIDPSFVIANVPGPRFTWPIKINLSGMGNKN
jgi:hypothetical protein